MEEKKAQLWVDVITNLLSGKNLVATRVVGDHLPEIRINQKFISAKVFLYRDREAGILINDTYGTFAENPDLRLTDHGTLHAVVKNGLEERVICSWHMCPRDDEEEEQIWHAIRESRKKLGHI